MQTDHLSSLPVELLESFIIPAIEGDKSNIFATANPCIKNTGRDFTHLGLASRFFYGLFKDRIKNLRILYEKNLMEKELLMERSPVYLKVGDENRVLMAVTSGRPEEVMVYLNAGANVNFRNRGGYSPLALATHLKYIEIQKIISQHPLLEKNSHLKSTVIK